MLKLTVLAVGAMVITAGVRPSPVAPLVIAPLAIIEAGTVSTLPKNVKARNGKVVVLRGRADRAVAVKPRPKAARPAPAAREPVRSCACNSGGGGSASDVMELRNTESGLRVMIIGPDGLTRTRYVPAPPGSTARHDQDA